MSNDVEPFVPVGRVAWDKSSPPFSPTGEVKWDGEEGVVEELPQKTSQDPDDVADLDASIAREEEYLASQVSPVPEQGTVDTPPPEQEASITTPSEEVRAGIESQLYGKTAAHYLQESLGVTVDGILGPESIRAAKKKWGSDAAEVIAGVKAQQRVEFKDATTNLSEEIAPQVGEGIKPEWIQAIWLHESASGNKVLANTFNLGNLKASGEQASKPFKVWEHLNGRDVTVDANFRVFDSFKQAADGWKDFVSASRYDEAREAKTFNGFISALKKAGYATDPKWVAGVKAAYGVL